MPETQHETQNETQNDNTTRHLLRDGMGIYGMRKSFAKNLKNYETRVLFHLFLNPRWCPSKVFSEFHCKVFQGCECCNQSVYVYLQSVLSVFHEKLQCHYGCTTVILLCNCFCQLQLKTKRSARGKQTNKSRETNIKFRDLSSVV